MQKKLQEWVEREESTEDDMADDESSGEFRKEEIIFEEVQYLEEDGTATGYYIGELIDDDEGENSIQIKEELELYGAEEGRSTDCSVCSKSFSKNTQLTEHIIRRHDKASSDSEDLFVCSECNRNYSDRAKFTKHFRLVHLRFGKAPQEQCPYCPRFFRKNSTSLRSLRKSLLLHFIISISFRLHIKSEAAYQEGPPER